MTFIGRILDNTEKSKKTNSKKTKDKENKNDELTNLEDEDTNK